MSYIKTFHFTQADIDSAVEIDRLIEEALRSFADGALPDSDWQFDAEDAGDFDEEADTLEIVPTAPKGWGRMLSTLE